MPETAFEIAIILLLVLLDGFLAMAEIAVVSAHRVRLQQMAAQGNAGATAALQLDQSPNRFLSTVQVGITLPRLRKSPSPPLCSVRTVRG